MCGIVGYIGSGNASNVLLGGLNRLSYRGYDSAGMAVMDDQGHIHIRKTRGKLQNLERVLLEQPLDGFAGIGHTRWATHGEPNDLNAHPHTDVTGGIAVVHNGIIENHRELRNYLEKQGVCFISQTDTEVIAHLLRELYNGSMKETLARAQGMLQGSYAIGVICQMEPDAIWCMRNDSPLVLGKQDGEAYLASDIPALIAHTRDVIFLQDKEIAVLTRGGITVFDAYGCICAQTFHHVNWDVKSAEKGGYTHFMLKEIHEQPQALQNTLASRGNLRDTSWFPIHEDEAQKLQRVTICACGTAYHAAVVGKYVIEEYAEIPVEPAIASEYRYRKHLPGKGELVIAVSQSGETADTLAAVREAKRNGARVLAVCNVVGSTLAREVGQSNTLYTHAGPEIAVASTKAYITQAEMMFLIACVLAKLRKSISEDRLARYYEELADISRLAEETLMLEDSIRRIANQLQQKKHVFFIGRGLDYALAMEAALKLKEVSYLFSEAYAAGELKHGPIALLQEGSLVVAFVTQPSLLEKSLSNLQEVRARGAYVLAICQHHMVERVVETADEVLSIPDVSAGHAPLLAAIPLQLFAYCMAVERGCDVDQPRNLAKSVTVE